MRQLHGALHADSIELHEEILKLPGDGICLPWGLTTIIWLLFPVYSDPGNIDRDRPMALELDKIVRSGFNLRQL